jgi:hypothetical protein
MKYFKHFITEHGVKRVSCYNPEGTKTFIPEADDNMDWVRMQEEIEAGTSTIEEVDVPE